MPAPDALGQVLLALTAVVVVGRLLGRVFRDDGGHDANPAAARSGAGPAKAGHYVLVKSV